MLISDILSLLPADFPKIWYTWRVTKVIETLERDLNTAKGNLRESVVEKLVALNDILASQDVAPAPAKKTVVAFEGKDIELVEPPAKKPRKKQPLRPELTPLPKKREETRGRKSTIRHATLVYDGSKRQRVGKKSGVPTMISKYFDIPVKPHDVLDDIIAEYDTVFPDPSMTYKSNPRTYILWYIHDMVRSGTLVEVEG